MKKITYYFMTVLLLGFSYISIAQTLDQNAGWPNPNWTVTGTFNSDPTAFEADPTTTSNFAFDDDDAGPGSVDDIGAESPIIDLTAAYTAGETWLNLAVDYYFRQFGSDTLTLEYWDADAGVWVVWDNFDETAADITNDFCTGTRTSFTSSVLNIVSFTATQQSGFRYRLYYNDVGGYQYGFCFDAPTIASQTPPDCPDPIDLVVGNIMPGSADLGWTEIGSATLWDIEFLDITAGDTATGTPTESGVTNPYMVSGLVEGNEYAFYVRADCDGAGFSNWVGPLNFTMPPSNDLCENATVLTCGTPITGQSTVAASGGTGTSCIGTIGNDIWYQLSGSDVDVVLTVTASVEEPQVEVYESSDGTCGGITPGTCFASAGSGENPVEVSFTAFTGTEYYIRVGNWINGDPGVVFDIEAVCTPIQPAPDCAMEPITPANGEIDVPAFDPVTLSWTAPASGPTPTSYDIFVGTMSDGSDQAFFVNTTDTFFTAPVGAYDTTIYWTIVPINATTPASGCSLWSFTSASAPPPPTNDDCAGAVPLTPGTSFTDNVITGNNESATASEVADPSIPVPGCSFYAGGDVWYSVVVPANGELTIETQGNPVGDGGDTGMAVYSGTCGSLALVACDDDSSDDGFYSLISISDTNLAGQTLYIRIFEYQNDEIVNFQISAYSATLSVDNFETQSLFSYYPNPVTNNLTLNAQRDIQNVVVYNMLGQQVMRTAPNAVNSEVDMSALNTGAYFVQVTIDNTTETIRIIKN